MHNIKFQLDSNRKGAFYIEENGERLAEMVLRVVEKYLIVDHTKVSKKLKGQNIGKQLLEKMVDYARKEGLKVIPICPFVEGQFKKHPEEYADIWKKLSSLF